MAQPVSKAKTRPTLPGEQPNSRTLLNKLGFRIRMADRVIYKAFTQTVGITPVQYSVFALVAENEGMAQGAIGEVLDMDRASTMAMMDKLEKAGLIERRNSKVDRRRYALYLTAKGKEEILAFEARVQAVDGAFKQKLTPEQLRQLLDYLDILRAE